jgi:hypothetical protein
MTVSSVEELLEGRAPGLHKLGGAVSDPLHVLIGIATENVAAVRLRCDGEVSEWRVGVEGFFIFGATTSTPTIQALDRDGAEPPGQLTI